MTEDTCKKIKKSLYFEGSGEKVYVEIGVENAGPKVTAKTIIPFLKTLFEETIKELEDLRPQDTAPKTEERTHEHDTEENDMLSQKGSDQNRGIVSELRDIRNILEHIEDTLSDTTLGPGTVVNLAPAYAPWVTKADIQTVCNLSRKKFDKMMRDYEKRKVRL